MDTKENKQYQKGPIAWMIGNSVAANLLMLTLLIGGFMWGTKIKQEVFPEFNFDTVSISVSYPGASPEEVEQGIIFAIEEAVQGLEGVDEVTSSAREGGGEVTVEALLGYDLQKLSQDIQNEVDRITSFPQEAEEPTFAIVSRKREVISLAIYGDQDAKVLHQIGEMLRDQLLQKQEITQVELTGVRDLEISIEISQDTLRSYNLTLEEVAQKLSKASIELPGGGIKTQSGEILVRMKERRDYGREFAKIPIITSSKGTQVLLEDIAKITDGFEDTDYFATYNNKPAVMLEVYRVGEQTPLEIAKVVKDYVKEVKPTIPDGVNVTILRDRSKIYNQRLNLLLKNGYIGLGLVFILLSIFLEIRLAFWVSLGIPISFLGSLLVLPSFDISINMISLFAFIVALGIVVDDAIVVGENIYHFHQKGHSFMSAAIEGTRQVATPVIFSILTNVVTFIPIYFVPGIMGKMFCAIPVVVISVFLISLVECLLILPAHIGHQKQQRNRFGLWIHKYQQKFSFGFMHWVRDFYGPFLQKTIRYRYITSNVGIVILCLTIAYVKSGRMGLSMFPRIESDYARVTAVLPYGSSVQNTLNVQSILIKAAQDIAKKNEGDKLFTGIFAEIGGTSRGISGSHITELRVFMNDPEIRPMSTADFVSKWRKHVGNIPGVETINFRSDSGGPGSSRSALTIELSHKSLEVLEAASEEVAKALDNFSSVKDIDDGFSPGKQQINFTIRSEARGIGFTAFEIATQIRNSFYGAEVLRQQRGRNEIKVKVRLPKNERISEYNIEELILHSPKGKEIPLREVVNIERGRAYTSIDRRAGRRIVSVTCDVNPQSKAGQILEALNEETLPNLKQKYAGLNYSFEGKQADMEESMNSLIKGLIVAIMLIYAILAIPFKSYMQPSIIMSAIPFGIVGAVIGHIIMGYSLSLMSLFGIVALSGVVVNDSLVLIDFANRSRAKGKSVYDAIQSAGITRFRPIFLTTLTTFFGLTPMILETSRQARFLIPMAISLGFGILFATLITLILIPSFYVIVEDLRKIIADL